VAEVGTFDVTSLPAANSTSQTNNAVPNPPSLAGLTGDFSILVFAAWHLSSAATVAVTAPSSYTERWECAGSQDVEFSLAKRDMSALSNATEDPGTFGDDVSPNGTCSMTVALLGFTISDIAGDGATSATVQESAGAGTVSTSGAGATASSAETSTGAGTLEIAGTGATSATAQVSAGEGTVESPFEDITGSGATIASSQDSLGGGGVEVSGVASSSSTGQSSASAGAVSVAGNVASAATPQTSASTGTAEIAGTGTTSAVAQAAASAGAVSIVGMAATASTAQISDGVGDVDDGSIAGAGETIASAMSSDGVGVVLALPIHRIHRAGSRFASPARIGGLRGVTRIGRTRR
jgi:hypothetical protein